jgi:hypothetical protein
MVSQPKANTMPLKVASKPSVPRAKVKERKASKEQARSAQRDRCTLQLLLLRIYPRVLLLEESCRLHPMSSFLNLERTNLRMQDKKKKNHQSRSGLALLFWYWLLFPILEYLI